MASGYQPEEGAGARFNAVDAAAGQVLPLKVLRPRAGILEVLHVLVTPIVH